MKLPWQRDEEQDRKDKGAIKTVDDVNERLAKLIEQLRKETEDSGQERE